MTIVASSDAKNTKASVFVNLPVASLCSITASMRSRFIISLVHSGQFLIKFDNIIP